MKVKVTQSCLTLCNPVDCPWNSLGQNTGVGSLSLLQGIFPTQGLNPGLPHCRRILYQLSHKGSPVNVVPSAYLRLLILLPGIMIPAWSSSSPAFCMIYSAFKLNKQCDNMQSWHLPFPIWNQSVTSGSNCCFLTCIQVSQEAGKVVWYSHLFKNFPHFFCDPHGQ